MNKKWLAIGWATLGLTCLMAVLILKGALAIKDREEKSAYSNLERESAALSRLVGQQVEGLSKDLQRDVSLLLATPDAPKPTDFSAVALLHLNAQNEWDSKWLAISEEISAKATEAQLQLAIKDLPLSSGDKLVGAFARLQDPLLATTFAFVIPVQRQDSPDRFVAVGLLPAPLLSRWSDIFRGSDREMLVLDNKGYALALSEPAYVGSLLDKQPFVADVLKLATSRGRLETRNFAQQKTVGVFEKVPDTNLLVLIDRPRPSLRGVLYDLFFQVLVVWLGMVILVGAGLWMWIPEPGSPTEFKKESNALPTSGPVSIPAVSPAPPMDRNMAYKVVGPGLIQAMKGPLAVILGHAQLAHAKTSDPALREHHQMLEKEARRLRETLEALGQLSGVEYTQESKKVEVIDVLEQAIDQMQERFKSQKIQLAKDLSVRGTVMAVPDPLKTMFIELLNNAIESMEGQATKELKIISEQRENRFLISIRDSGVGMSAEDLTKAFEPFFTTKAREDHAGLGLTMARGLMRGFGGELTVETKKDNGTRVQIEWPLDVVLAKPIASSSLAESLGGVVEEKPIESVLTPTVVSESPPLLGGKPPVTGPLAAKIPDRPELPFLSQEDEEEWQQLPKQLHSESESDSVQIRKPKVRIRLGN
jgi:anti-sigma regulatory factor (Ser/Thr protein kinase)